MVIVLAYGKSYVMCNNQLLQTAMGFKEIAYIYWRVSFSLRLMKFWHICCDKDKDMHHEMACFSILY